VVVVSAALPGDRAVTTTRFICPFCDLVVHETDNPIWDVVRAEATTRLHLLAHHPIRWRLSRKFRRAMKTGKAA
jgi:hypothetical protein